MVAERLIVAALDAARPCSTHDLRGSNPLYSAKGLFYAIVSSWSFPHQSPALTVDTKSRKLSESLNLSKTSHVPSVMPSSNPDPKRRTKKRSLSFSMESPPYLDAAIITDLSPSSSLQASCVSINNLYSISFYSMPTV